MQKALTPAIAVLLCGMAVPAAAQSTAAPAAANTGVGNAAADAVSEASLRQIIDTLVAFGTRHTLSVQDHPTRGIGAARRWAESEFRRFGAACGNCLEIALPEDMVSGNRIPTPTRLVDVLAIQRGTERPNEVVIIAGHIDSRVTDVMNATSDAPGANDDGSGTAAVIEAARVLSQHRFPTTIVFAVLSGEEQGLYGGRLLAQYAAAQGWTVKAMLNNDIIGGTRGADGLVVNDVARVFSEGPRSDGNDAYRAAARREGGENDSASRNLSRFIAGLAPNAHIGIGVRQVYRADRFGRGGDHFPMLEAGFPAIRITVGIEDYDHQHQDLRTENGKFYGDTPEYMDFPYLAGMVRLNVVTLAALANAPMPPAPHVQGAVSTDTSLNWLPVAGATRYQIYRRRTDERDWQAMTDAPAPTTTADGKYQVTLPSVRVDDWVFGVSSIAANGSESPIASAVPGGAFAPLPR